MPPLVDLGTCLRLVGRGRLDQIGFALAGIGVIFLGIDSLQEATAGHWGCCNRIEQSLVQVHLRYRDEPEAQRLLHLLHSLDHLQLLGECCEEEPEQAGTGG